MNTKKLYFYSFGIDEKTMKLNVSEDCVEVKETPKCYRTLDNDTPLPKRYSNQILKVEVGDRVTHRGKLVLGYDYQIVLEEDNVEKAVGIIRHLLWNKLKFHRNKVSMYEYMINKLNAWGDV